MTVPFSISAIDGYCSTSREVRVAIFNLRSVPSALKIYFMLETTVSTTDFILGTKEH